jgi:hypothetical protein
MSPKSARYEGFAPSSTGTHIHKPLRTDFLFTFPTNLQSVLAARRKFPPSVL